jgi:hypothetical protein
MKFSKDDSKTTPKTKSLNRILKFLFTSDNSCVSGNYLASFNWLPATCFPTATGNGYFQLFADCLLPIANSLTISQNYSHKALCS